MRSNCCTNTSNTKRQEKGEGEKGKGGEAEGEKDNGEKGKGEGVTKTTRRPSNKHDE